MASLAALERTEDVLHLEVRHAEVTDLNSTMSSALLTATLLLWAPRAASDQAPEKAGVSAPRIEVEIRGLSSDLGLVRCALHASARTFPSRADLAIARVSSKVEGRKATCVFRDVKVGTYAISVFHDRNSDGTLSRDAAGFPAEPWGASNDPVAFMGPPSFDDAKFDYSGSVRLMAVTLK